MKFGSYTLIALCFLGATGYLFRAELTSFSAESEEYSRVKGQLTTEAEHGIAYFAFGDFNALTSQTLQVSASPWKLAVAALALGRTGGDLDQVADVSVADMFRRFGFHSPRSFGNWPASLDQPEILTPVGQNVGDATNPFLPIGATIGNIGCAACHSSVMYNADGTPDTSRVWLGMPNGSINLEAYTATLFNAMRAYGGDGDRLMQAVNRMFPETRQGEIWTLRYFILPEFQKVVAERDAELGRLMPFRASLAGATNGLDSLKNRLGLIPENTVLTESIFNSVPDLGGRLWRTKLLNSGTYAIPGIDHTATIAKDDIDADHRRGLAGIIAYFTVPSMGVTPEVAETAIDQAFQITTWMTEYAPQPFPGRIDMNLVREGRPVYAQSCASCHGVYDDNLENPALVSFPNWEGDIGTDPQRARLLTAQIADAVNGSLFGKYIQARTVDTYTAPPLTGIWASAPYFHNGSVPTLSHLMGMEARPNRFRVGGHKLDLDKVGIAGVPNGMGGLALPPEYQPWSEDALVDTAAFGLTNTGHEAEFAPLTGAEKRALLEYLKKL